MDHKVKKGQVWVDYRYQESFIIYRFAEEDHQNYITGVAIRLDPKTKGLVSVETHTVADAGCCVLMEEVDNTVELLTPQIRAEDPKYDEPRISIRQEDDIPF
jgi:hypothetical protein